LTQLREPARFRSWLAQIAVSLVIGVFDAGDFGEWSSSVPPAITMSRPLRRSSIRRNAHARAELVALGRELGRMPPDHQIAWMLRYVEGEDLEDVARLCGCSLATAKRRIAAASERLRQRALLDEEE